MGNRHQEPSRHAQPSTDEDLFDQPIIPNSMSSFMKLVPIEIKIHTFSFIPMHKLTNLLLISKPLKNSILRSDDIFSILYIDFRKRVIEEIPHLDRRFQMGYSVDLEMPEGGGINLPERIEDIPNKSIGKKISKNYKILRNVAENHIKYRKRMESLTIHQRVAE